MCNFNDVFDSAFPKSWLDPYGDMPMNPGLQASVDIEVTKSDGVTKVTAVKTPPRSQHMSFEDALEMVLSITSCENEPLCTNLQAADQGKCEDEKCPDSSGEKEKEPDPVGESNALDDDSKPFDKFKKKEDKEKPAE